MSEIEMTREQIGDYIEQHTGALKALIAERDSEIERLQAQHQEMLLKAAREQGVVLEALEAALEQIGANKTLLIRAADALADRDRIYGAGADIELIGELREAAE